jgi:hypothetical protein
LRPFQSNAKGKKSDYLQKYFFLINEFSVTEIRTRAQGLKSKNLTPCHGGLNNKVALNSVFIFYTTKVVKNPKLPGSLDTPCPFFTQICYFSGTYASSRWFEIWKCHVLFYAKLSFFWC